MTQESLPLSKWRTVVHMFNGQKIESRWQLGNHDDITKAMQDTSAVLVDGEPVFELTVSWKAADGDAGAFHYIRTSEINEIVIEVVDSFPGQSFDGDVM